MRVLIYLRRALASLLACVGGPRLLSWFFRERLNSQLGEAIGWKPVSKTLLPHTDLRKTNKEALWGQAASRAEGEPATEKHPGDSRCSAASGTIIHFRQRNPLQAVTFAGGNA